MDLAFLQTPPTQKAQLKAQCQDFVVKENLGYELSGDGEFVAVKVRKTDCNTLFVGEKLAEFVGISQRNMGYAGLKDRFAVTEQWFCLQMPGKPTPDFSSFQLEGVEILEITRHNRKIRTGSLEGNYFELLLRGAEQTEELVQRLQFLQQYGFPNYFTEQRFGRDGQNLTKALAWARGEIKVRDRKKRSFYLSAARSAIFNTVVSARLKQNLIKTILPNDILQLTGSHSWFVADDSQDFATLQQRLQAQDIALTAPLIGEGEAQGSDWEKALVNEKNEFSTLMERERMKAARRPILVHAKELSWQFEEEGLRLHFYLPSGSYATALVRELVNTQAE